MANALTAGALQISTQAKLSGLQIAPQGTATNVTLPNPTAEATASGTAAFAFGTGSGQCSIYCTADYLLNASGTVTIDIYANGLPNALGGDANFRTLKACVFSIVTGGDTAGVTIGNAASNAHALFFGTQTSTWTIYPGASGIPLSGSSAAGATVDATHRNIKITNNSSSVAVTVRVVLAGLP